MLEPEVAFMDLDSNMQLAEDMICHIVSRVLKNRRPELEALERDISKLEKIKKPFPRLHYNEAAEILEKESKDNFKKGMDFGGGDETILTQRFETPIFVHRFPKEIKAFYMKEDPQDPVSALSYDMLAPEGYGEVIGAGQREDNIEYLKQKIKDHGLDQNVFEWYLDLRRYGGVPTGGFGMGIERCTAWLCGTQHVRETIPFPRMLNRLSP
jgi:asparaginyl-tRNA synthetase